MQFLYKPFLASFLLLCFFSLSTPFAAIAQNNKDSNASNEKVIWGLEQINLEAGTPAKSEGEKALSESFRYLRDKMLPEEQLEFKAWNINLKATDSERGAKRNEKKAAKYLKQVEASSKYFIALVFEWDKDHLVKDLDVQMNLPDTVPAFQEFSKKQVTMMAKMIFTESLRSAGMMSTSKPK